MPHTDTKELLSKLENVKNHIEVGDKYFHYKHPDRFYKIIHIGFIEKTEEVCVVYEAEFGDKLVWVRPFVNFFSKAKLEDGTEIDRFTKVE